MSPENVVVTAIDESDITQHLLSIRSELSRLELEAFATGSRIRGTHDTSSDLDVVVVRPEDMDGKDVEELTSEIKRNTDLPFSLDIDCYSLHEIKTRLSGGDPMIFTLFSEFVPLTLSDETLNAILETIPDSPPDSSTQFIDRIKNKNKSTACVVLLNDLIYDGYRCLVTNGELPVPPEELGERLRGYDTSTAERVETALQLEKRMKSGKADPETVLEELLGLYSDKP